MTRTSGVGLTLWRLGRCGPAPLIILVSVLLCAGPASAPAAVFEPLEFASPAHQARYRRIVEELRCLVCQNQNLADSDAGLAQDLRREVYRMIADGHGDHEIFDFMVARYGSFVLYRPPFDITTMMLWLGPALLVALGVVIAVRAMRRQRREAGGHRELSEDERSRIEGWLASDRDV